MKAAFVVVVVVVLVVVVMVVVVVVVMVVVVVVVVVVVDGGCVCVCACTCMLGILLCSRHTSMDCIAENYHELLYFAIYSTYNCLQYVPYALV